MKLFRTKSIESALAQTHAEGHSLKRNLGVWDMAMMAVAVSVGAGIFSVGAQVIAFHAGPAAIVSFLIAGLACVGVAFCYAEFASMVPAAGSAYTFTYTTLGEFIAWIIGWDLILELLMAASVISKYWGLYFREFFRLIGFPVETQWHVSEHFTIDFAPMVIVAFFTVLLLMGTKISSDFDAVLTVVKVGVVLFIIVAGFFYFKVGNLTPFVPPQQSVEAVSGSGSSVLTSLEQPLLQKALGLPDTMYGFGGVLSGAALVFFAFIGFDIIATAAEEAKEPKRTVPLGITIGLGIVIFLYVMVTLVTSGMISYDKLAQMKSPSLATAFELVGADWAAQIISFGILVGLTTVVMVLLLGLTRVVFAMSRDKLLPEGISHTNKRGVPATLQIVSSIVVALIASTMDINVLADMVNIGTLSAFVLVCVGVPIMRKKRPDLERAFKAPGSPWLPLIVAAVCFVVMLYLSVLTWIRFLVWLVAGITIYFAYSYRHSRLNEKA
ncbi:amino acid permease [Alloscardovia omnicolens]|uniref:APC family permease n=1 Tax=Alloscardovia omnicolens TaxID=419015 RepID=UPI00242D6BDB|nr:amino acid permease [Alloscardovia omnicolens]MBS6346363.1 amino acid permease [Alloscardovia omnicolens]MDK6251733.1 amino acid permease [Alloscardovia omnicolens]MDU6533534.1 amino acid permease [Alloscardovia omnicolens]